MCPEGPQSGLVSWLLIEVTLPTYHTAGFSCALLWRPQINKTVHLSCQRHLRPCFLNTYEFLPPLPPSNLPSFPQSIWFQEMSGSHTGLWCWTFADWLRVTAQLNNSHSGLIIYCGALHRKQGKWHLLEISNKPGFLESLHKIVNLTAQRNSSFLEHLVTASTQPWV